MKNLKALAIQSGILATYMILAVGCSKSLNYDTDSSTGSDALTVAPAGVQTQPPGSSYPYPPNSNPNPNPQPSGQPPVIIGSIPVIGSGPVSCMLYDLSPYFISQGCPITLNNPSNPLPGTPVDLNSLFACGMRLPDDFSTLNPLAIMKMDHFDIQLTDWLQGLPGMDGKLAYLREWYGISCVGTLSVPQDDLVNFRLMSDDGSKLFVDGRLVVDDDGLHPDTSASGAASLLKGVHKFRVDWYQGPRFGIALKLFWTRPGTTTDEIIPVEAFGGIAQPSCRL